MARGRLLLDAMLGKLATYLRMCGYDAVYVGDTDLEEDDEIRRRALETDRRLLTRDERLAARTDRAALLESREIEGQLAELSAAGFELSLPETPDRCGACNGPLERVDPDEHPSHAPNDQSIVWSCRRCGQHFWKGSHWERVERTVREATE